MHKSQIFIFFCIIAIIFLGFCSLYFDFYPNQEKSHFVGLIVNEPDIRQQYTNLTIKSENINGLILVRANLYPEYEYGDLLEINCDLQKPKNSENFNYEKYLAVSDIYYTCYQPEIELLAHNQGNIFFTKLFQFKKYLYNIIEKIWAMPVSAFIAGLLLGLKKVLPQEITDDFMRTGTIHILVVSGSHLVIFSGFLKEILKNLYINRKKQFYIISIVLILYVIFTGMSAAAVRACLLAILVMLAEKVGRPKATFNILIFSAFLMILQNPRILFYDTGFQLSFLATVGLVYLSKPMEKILFFIPKIFSIRNLLAQTLAAIIMTNPLICWQFQRISLIAPLANLLTVPLISMIMIASMGVIILYIIFPAGGQLAGWAVGLLVQFVLWINHYLAGLDWASIILTP
jgi:competence protein ComEC